MARAQLERVDEAPGVAEAGVEPLERGGRAERHGGVVAGHVEEAAVGGLRPLVVREALVVERREVLEEGDAHARRPLVGGGVLEGLGGGLIARGHGREAQELGPDRLAVGLGEGGLADGVEGARGVVEDELAELGHAAEERRAGGRVGGPLEADEHHADEVGGALVAVGLIEGLEHRRGAEAVRRGATRRSRPARAPAWAASRSTTFS